jgi:hypothetical protein
MVFPLPVQHTSCWGIEQRIPGTSSPEHQSSNLVQQSSGQSSVFSTATKPPFCPSFTVHHRFSIAKPH